MAKRHKSRSLALARRSSAKPIVIRTTKIVKSKHRRHARGLVSRAGGIFSKHNITTAGAGFAVGMLEKMTFVQNLPSLPYVGKTGTIGIAAYLMSDGGKNRMAADVASAALAIAGYMLGNQGSIIGDGSGYEGVDTSGYVAGW